jgi:hypothetical protein
MWVPASTTPASAGSSAWIRLIAPEALTDGDEEWTHLTVVHDDGLNLLKLYVNGTLAASATNTTMWHAGGALTVGSSWYTPDTGAGYWTDQWFGGIDDLFLYQGALTDAQVLTLHDQQSAVDS